MYTHTPASVQISKASMHKHRGNFPLQTHNDKPFQSEHVIQKFSIEPWELAIQIFCMEVTDFAMPYCSYPKLSLPRGNRAVNRYTELLCSWTGHWWRMQEQTCHFPYREVRIMLNMWQWYRLCKQYFQQQQSFSHDVHISFCTAHTKVHSYYVQIHNDTRMHSGTVFSVISSICRIRQSLKTLKKTNKQNNKKLKSCSQKWKNDPVWLKTIPHSSSVSTLSPVWSNLQLSVQADICSTGHSQHTGAWLKFSTGPTAIHNVGALVQQGNNGHRHRMVWSNNTRLPVFLSNQGHPHQLDRKGMHFS